MEDKELDGITDEAGVQESPSESITAAENVDNEPSDSAAHESGGAASESGNAEGEGAPSAVLTEFYSWFDTLLHALIAVIVLFTFFTRMSTVDGTSMLPTLEDGQRLMITDFLYTPAYNDIVVVWSELLPNDNGEQGKAIVKRVVGLAGDRISIDYANGYVYRNGEQLEIEVKDGVLYEDGHMINSYTNTDEGRGGEFTVPEGKLFVMGDNRNGSTDSRSYMVGYIDRRDLVGKAYLRIWPFDSISLLYGGEDR